MMVLANLLAQEVNLIFQKMAVFNGQEAVNAQVETTLGPIITQEQLLEDQQLFIKICLLLPRSLELLQPLQLAP